ncbi:MAG: Na+/H+ antiporter NhaC family protein [Clostridiaceae bacterium]|nr:Na+/H+ antiporter NhaC family protein [Clostridiaceae bacterium]
MDSSVYFGPLSLIPAIIVFAFALYTKKTFEALLLGAITAYIMVFKGAFLSNAIDVMYSILANADTQWVFLVCGLFGFLLAMLEKSHGSFAFASVMNKYFKSKKATLVASIFLGLIIFIDDYLSVLTVGSSVRPVADKKRIPRESLAFIAQGTAAPICLLAPVSTWAVFWAGIYGNQVEWQPLGDGMSLFTKSIPFVFYSYAILIVMFLFALGKLPLIGSMKSAHLRVENGGKTYSEASEKYNTEPEDMINDEIDVRGFLNFLIPIGVLIGVSVWKSDLLIAVIIAIVVCIIMYLPTKIMSFDTISSCFVKGFETMLPMFFIVFGAFFFQDAAAKVGLTAYVVDSVKPLMSSHWLPAITFAVISLIAFITGSNWGGPAVVVPMVAPLCAAVSANPLLTLGAISSASGFGAHSAIFADNTVLASTATKLDNTDHAFSQLPYTLIAFAIAFIAFVIMGYIL